MITKKNSLILVLSLALLVVTLTNISIKKELNQKNNEIELLGNKHVEFIKEIKLLNMKTLPFQIVEVYDEIDVTDNKVSIPAYNKPTYISLSHFDVESLEEYDLDFYKISIKKYLPKWMINIDIDKLQFIDEFAYVNKNSTLTSNTNLASGVTCDLISGTPVLVKYQFEDKVYVESQIKWDTNTIYSGWIKTEYIDFESVSTNDYDNKYIFIPKNTLALFASTDITLEDAQWGLLIDESESEYYISVKGAGVYQINKNEIFIE